MKRRNFIKTSAWGLASAATLTNINDLNARTLTTLQQLTDEGGPDMLKALDPIVPFLYYPEKEEFMLQQLIEIKEKYGPRRFVFIGPYPKSAEEYKLTAYRELGKQIKHVKEKLKPHGIDIGWWGVGLRYGKELGQGFQRIVNIDGNVTLRSYCPLDQRFQQFMADNILELIREAHPFVVQFDDDYELSWQPPGNNNFGCFCPLHLKMFGERTGRYYSREELVAIFSEVTPESKRLRRAWAEMSRDSLELLAAEVRKAVDQVAPETRLSLCQAGCCDFDGDFTESVTKAFAGNTRPMVRLYGTEYTSDRDMGIPNTVFHMLYSRQHLPEEFECFYEADTAPHIRFYMSATKLKTLVSIALSYGLEDLLLYAAQYNDTPLEERGYFEMYRSEAKRLSALKEAVAGCDVSGCEIIHNPFSHIAAPYGGEGGHGIRRNDWIHVLGRMGIPYTTKGGKVKMLSNNISDSLTDEEIKSLLSGSLVIDGQAAEALFNAGWGKWLGITNVEKLDTSTEVGFGSERTDKYVLTPSNNAQSVQSLSSHSVLDWVGGDTSRDNKRGVSNPDLVLFENELGGRVAVFALSLSGNHSSQVFNYKMKQWFQQVIEWSGDEPLPLFVKNKPNAFCIFNRERARKYGIATVISLSSDLFDTFELDVAPEWSNGRVERLNEQGQWVPAEISKTDSGFIVKEPLAYLTPLFLKFSTPS